MARPRKAVDSKQVQKLAAVGCTTTDIAFILGCSADTLTRRFAAELNKGRSEGRTTLRRRQWAAAMSGNVTMMIFLGKQMLGQSDRADITSAGARLAAPSGIVTVLEMPSNGREPGARAAAIERLRAAGLLTPAALALLQPGPPPPRDRPPAPALGEHQWQRQRQRLTRANGDATPSLRRSAACRSKKPPAPPKRNGRCDSHRPQLQSPPDDTNPALPVL